MKWRDLKEFVNSLPEEKLDNNVVLWREDDVINDIIADTLEQDQYIGPDDEGCYDESDATEPIETLKKVYSKGDPILWEKF